VAQGTQVPVERGPASRSGARPPGRRSRSGTTTTAGLIIKIVLLGLVLAVAIFGAFPLIEQRQWLGLALLIGITALLFWIYLSPAASRRNTWSQGRCSCWPSRSSPCCTP
jgi:arabinogalactan oligomer / maltooligosaccharide transport system permease protein